MVGVVSRSILGFFMCGILWACTEDVGVETSSEGTEEIIYPPTAGFVTIPEREVTVGGFGFSERGTVTEAKLFYSFIPAKADGADKPVFVFLNGGPGAATSSALAAWGTGPFSMTPTGDVVESDGDFSTLGNLIYIDSRQAGFSFDEVDDPSAAESRAASFNFLNYNLYTDVSNILLCLLRVTAERPWLEGNPMVIVAESYGGARAAVLLSLVRDAAAGVSGNPAFEDAVLFERLREHFERIGDGDLIGAAERQFARQVLIQPGRVLPERVEAAHTLYSLCDHLGADDPRFVYCDGRVFDYSDIREPEGFFDTRNRIAQSVLLTPLGFETFFGVSWMDAAEFRAENRGRAFRFAQTVEVQVANMDGAPPLQPWDALHITMHIDPYFSWRDTEAYASYESGQWAAQAFVRGLATVHTFITDAYYDFAVDSRQLPGALLEWNFLQDEPVITDARYRSDLDVNTPRPGWMEVTFVEGEYSQEAMTRVIRMPVYSDAGHMVPMYQPRDFMEDVRAFLVDTGLAQVAGD